MIAVLLTALRDAHRVVRFAAARALGEIAKVSGRKTSGEEIRQITSALFLVFEDPANQSGDYFFVADKFYSSSHDVFWEALWLACQRLEAEEARERIRRKK